MNSRHLKLCCISFPLSILWVLDDLLMEEQETHFEGQGYDVPRPLFVPMHSMFTDTFFLKAGTQTCFFCTPIFCLAHELNGPIVTWPVNGFEKIASEQLDEALMIIWYFRHDKVTWLIWDTIMIVPYRKKRPWMQRMLSMPSFGSCLTA